MLGMSAARCWFTAVIRRILLSAAGAVILVTALVLVWAFRYEMVPGAATWRLADLRASVPSMPGVEWIGSAEDPSLRLRVNDEHPAVALRLAMPVDDPVGMLHMRYRLQARGLIKGAEKWQTGRIMIEWHAPDGSAEPEIDPIGGIEDDKSSDAKPMVAVSARGEAIPALRLEHLGRAGEFTLSDLEIMPVRERALWKTGRWLLAAGFAGWLLFCIRLWSGASHLRATGAAVVWLVMGMQFVIPGPWKIQRPLVFEHFRLGMADVSEKPLETSLPPPSKIVQVRSGEVPASGEVMPQGSLALRVKLLISKARVILHVLLLLVPTLASAWLVGRRASLCLAILCTAAIELAQIAFGYGFDWMDVLDLATDAAGIAAGLWLVRRLPLALAHDRRH